MIGLTPPCIEHCYSGPLPLLGNEWPFVTTRVSHATGARQLQYNRTPSFLWDVNPPPVTEHQIDGTEVIVSHT
jgi:hypothetical protein